MAALRRMLTPEGGDAQVASSPTKGAQAAEPQATADADAQEPGLNQGAGGYVTVNGTAFASEGSGDKAISPYDITQGQLGDCWLLSAMAAIAREDPEGIRRLIKDNGDGTYDVTLYLPISADSSGSSSEEQWKSRKRQVFHVDNKFPTLAADPNVLAYAQPGQVRGQAPATVDPSRSQYELWPMLLEKAVATAAGSYSALDGNNVDQGLKLLTPDDVFSVEIAGKDPTAVLQAIAFFLQSRRPVMAGTTNPFTPDSVKHADELGLVAGHAYSVMSVDCAARTISLQNPWGRQDVIDMSVGDFFTYYFSYAIGAP